MVTHQLLKIGKALLLESDIESVLARAMDAVTGLFGAERGMIILFRNGREIMFETARNMNQTDIKKPEFEVSRTLIDQVRETGKPVYLKNALDDPALAGSESIRKLNVLSVMCLPLQVRAKIIGLIYLDNRTVRGMFTDEQYEMMKEFSEFIALTSCHTLDRKRLQNKADALEWELRRFYNFDSIIGHHPKMMAVLELVSQVADTDATVLITGESGTGKELIARALHYNSRRRDKPLTAINCGALPEQLLESELFGHVKGAFTGAVSDKPGWFEQADGGTLFLDEVNQMSKPLQVKLLRILQTGEFSRVGSVDIRLSDVRIVAASSSNLIRLVEEGQFREELFYRLNIIELDLPPLRERMSDVPALAGHFMKLYGEKYHKADPALSKEAESVLMSYDYPGNVRELENILQRAVILTKDGQIQPDHFPDLPGRRHNLKGGTPSGTFRKAKEKVVEQFEKDFIITALKDAKGVVLHAAKNSAMDPKNFYKKMQKYHIQPIDFKKR